MKTRAALTTSVICTMIFVLTIITQPAHATTIGLISGGDVGEGADLDGNIVYAIDASGNSGTFSVRDATFSPLATGTLGGVTLTNTNSNPGWSPGPQAATSPASWNQTTDDTNLANVLEGISWSSGSDVLIDMAVLSGEKYKLQLMFYEGCCLDRGFDVLVEGQVIVPGFVTTSLVDTHTNGNRLGTIITHEFDATDTQLNIVLDSVGSFTDNNPILNGFTLELIPFDPNAVPEPSTGLLMGLGIVGVLIRRRRRGVRQ